MSGLFISLEGTEGGGKSTQIKLLTGRLRELGHQVVELREPGGTPAGEEIRHLLKHSEANRGLVPEAELMLICASRAQLVRDVIRPALERGSVVVCDRFYDSTVAYQGYGRQLDLAQVKTVIDLAVDDTHPDLTLFLHVPVAVSEQRRALREANGAQPRDRFEEADRSFFERVERGFAAIVASEPERVKEIDASASITEVQARIWELVEARLART